MATYLHGKGAKYGLPIGGNFELTARCNFNCPMCYVHLDAEDIEARGKELTAEQWIKLAREAKEEGLMFALLTGGEPFVRRDFFEIYSAMKDMGLLVSINSNGSMLSGEIQERLLDNPPFRINVSLYGGSRQTYGRMCGNQAFDQVLENVRALKEKGIDIRLNVSITPYNQQDLPRIYEIAQELGVIVKASAYMYPPIRVHDDRGHRLSPEEAARCTVQWDTLRFSPEVFDARALEMKNRACIEREDCAMDLDEGVSCRAGSTSFWITWDGRMLPCGMMPGPEVRPLETGFRDAWQELRRRTKELRMPVKCTGCKNRKMCPVCAAVCVTETGAFDQVPEYVCRMTEENLRLTWQTYLERNGEQDGN
jgi:radical SAM protein with 4Fe4S-binding SPASM domain